MPSREAPLPPGVQAGITSGNAESYAQKEGDNKYSVEKSRVKSFYKRTTANFKGMFNRKKDYR